MNLSCFYFSKIRLFSNPHLYPNLEDTWEIPALIARYNEHCWWSLFQHPFRCFPVLSRHWLPQLHWNKNVVILTKFSSLTALEVVILTTSSAASDDNFIKMKTFPFLCKLRSYHGTIHVAPGWYRTWFKGPNPGDLTDAFATSKFLIMEKFTNGV